MIEIQWFGPKKAIISWTPPDDVNFSTGKLLYFVRIWRKNETYMIYKTKATSLKEDFKKIQEENLQDLGISVYCIGNTDDEEHMILVENCMEEQGCLFQFKTWHRFEGYGTIKISRALDMLISESETNPGLLVSHEQIDASYVYNRAELYAAYDKCAKYLSEISKKDCFVAIEEISRCANQADWERISKNYRKATSIVIPKRRKDEIGHSRYGLNGVLEGVFFTPAMYTDEVFSPFGTEVISFDATKYLDPAKFNYYFADFYCLKTSEDRIHNVIVVICQKNTVEDRYCVENFKLLDPIDNLFLKVEAKEEISQVKVGDYRLCNVYTELFLLGDVSVTEEDHVRFTDVINLGRLTLGTGYTHNKDCCICNPTFPH